MTSHAVKLLPRWIIGRRVQGKYQGHVLHRRVGTVQEVMPTGFAGEFDEIAVLVVRMDSGELIAAGADQWVTA